MEQRFNNYLNSLIQDNTFELAQLTGFYPNLSKGEFIGIKNNYSKYYILTETFQDNTYSYSYSEIKNKDDKGIQSFDERVDDLIFLNSESLPKTNDGYYKDKTEYTIKLWKEIINSEKLIVPEYIRLGLPLIDEPDEALTEIEITLKTQVLNYIYKLNARYRIEQEVGDTQDLIADLSKRLALLERMLLRLFLDRANLYPLSDDILTRYGQYALPLIQTADDNIPIDRIDLEENEVEMISKLTQKNQQIMNIVDVEYLSKI